MVGHLVLAYFWTRTAIVALAKRAEDETFYGAKLATARFYMQKLLPETAALIRRARAGSAVQMDVPVEQFLAGR